MGNTKLPFSFVDFSVKNFLFESFRVEEGRLERFGTEEKC